MRKILKSYGMLFIAAIVFLACSYWILSNINFNNIIGKEEGVQSVGSKNNQK